MQSVMEFADAGGPVMGMCNGFQILCEAGLLPGVLIQNSSLSFICEWARIRVETTRTTFTVSCRPGEILRLPIKHGDGCYVADEATLKQLEDNGQVVFRYVDAAGEATEEANPNGALRNIAGVTNARGNVVGLMPHPEHAVEALLGSEDGRKLFLSALAVRNS
jgi:phosphoribosylformylglycinamidine synthase